MLELAPVLSGTPSVEVGLSIEQNVVTNIARLSWPAAQTPASYLCRAAAVLVCRAASEASCEADFAVTDSITGQSTLILENQDKSQTPYLAVRAIDGENNTGNVAQIKTESNAPVELVRYNGTLYDASKVRLVSNSDGSLAEVQVDVSGDGSYALKIPATADGTLAVASFSPTVSGLAENSASSAYDGAKRYRFLL